MFISSKVERECSIYWHLSYSVATPAGVIIILLTRTLPLNARGSTYTRPVASMPRE